MRTILKTFGFIFSLLFINLLSMLGQVKHDSISVYRIGLDLSRFAYRIDNSFFAPKRIAYEGAFDFKRNKKLYPTIEAGWQEMSIEETNFNYSSRGYYIRLGTDFNIFKPKNPKDKSEVFWGLRYGYGRMWDHSDNVVISDDVWGDYKTSLPERALNNHWVELVGGVKAEIVNNFYLGWTIRWRVRVIGSSFNSFTPYIIPGFGYGSNRSNIGFNYYMFYRLPFM
jgi:hypothetical protein